MYGIVEGIDDGLVDGTDFDGTPEGNAADGTPEGLEVGSCVGEGLGRTIVGIFVGSIGEGMILNILNNSICE